MHRSNVRILLRMREMWGKISRHNFLAENMKYERIIFHEWKKRKERNGTVKHEKFARRQIYLLL